MEFVEIFGAVAVGAMALFYALEERSAGFVLAFAGACLASSGYAVAIGSWPFASVELLWAGVALRRWLRIRRREETHGDREHARMRLRGRLQPPA